MFSITYEYLQPCSRSVNGVSLALSTHKPLKLFGLCE
jgi:hypothetical protein